MPPVARRDLERFAKRYIWWQAPEVAAETPRRVVVRVMDIGDYDDVQAVAELAGDAYLRDVLTHAEAGQFNARSWHYWHYRLGLSGKPDGVPRCQSANWSECLPLSGNVTGAGQARSAGIVTCHFG